jgi:hypothetical protein
MSNPLYFKKEKLQVILANIKPSEIKLVLSIQFGASSPLLVHVLSLAHSKISEKFINNYLICLKN